MAEPTLYLFDGYNLLHAGAFSGPRELRLGVAHVGDWPASICLLACGWAAIVGMRARRTARRKSA